jgi:hypothetical protein
MNEGFQYHLRIRKTWRVVATTRQSACGFRGARRAPFETLSAPPRPVEGSYTQGYGVSHEGRSQDKIGLQVHFTAESYGSMRNAGCTCSGARW